MIPVLENREYLAVLRRQIEAREIPWLVATEPEPQPNPNPEPKPEEPAPIP